MKKIMAMLVTVALVIPASAHAGPRHGHGYMGGHFHRGHWIAPALVGGAVVYQFSQPRPIYVPVRTDPIYAVPVVAPQAPVWYWCAEANAYYPYVDSCPNGWQSVPATPPPPPPSN